jgi:metal-sulfur cluster biosynthetic enzyme
MACGDMVTMYLKIDEKSHKITDIKFKSFGCASNIATCSALTEIVKGKTIEDVKKITFKEIGEFLGGLPSVKVHCSVLATVTLQSAIKNYEEAHGLIDSKEEVNEENIKKRLRHVMDPDKGKDIISQERVKKIMVKGETIEVLVELPQNYRYAEAVFEDIKEHLITLPKIKKIDVEIVKSGAL